MSQRSANENERARNDSISMPDKQRLTHFCVAEMAGACTVVILRMVNSNATKPNVRFTINRIVAKGIAL